jgi:hypothetical protein
MGEVIGISGGEVEVAKDVTFDQSDRGRMVRDGEDLYDVVSHAADTMELLIDLAGGIVTDDYEPKLEAIQLLAKQRYEDLVNGMVFLSERNQDL